MAGVDTVRGIAYQQAQAVLAALDVLDALDLAALRVEGVHDVVDIELFTMAMSVWHAKQVKTRMEPYTWGEAELVAVLRRWANLPEADRATFEFLTNGRLGPSGEKVQAALEQAALGRPQALADLLEEDVPGAACAALEHARVRVDAAGVGVLLLRAERQVAAMLPQARTAADAREQAQRAVDRLFRLLLDRAANPDPEARIVTRDEIAATLGVPADQPASQRWPGGVRDRYLQAALDVGLDVVVPQLVEPHGGAARSAVRRTDAPQDEEQLECSALLSSNGPVILAGRTGTGKSTAARNLCRDAAREGQVVLLAHAETYLQGRLEALAADALSGLLGEDLPSATGRQVLADRCVTLVIDGVSEVPVPVRDALHDDLAASVAGGRGARIVLVGRDVAVLREVLPSSVMPAAYQMVELDADRRFDLACRKLLGRPPTDGEQDRSADEVRIIVAQVGHALGDAAGNPLLFTMALTLIAEGIPFTSRASLYQKFVERLAERSGATGIVIAAAALGIIYARLLDEGRRYADPYEWAQLLDDVTAELRAAGQPTDPRAIDTAVRRCGLITPIGYTQTLAPIHDSFADYLAGAAHARRASPYPPKLRADDDQRVLFGAEISGVNAALALLVARDQPFLTVRLAGFDRRDLTEEAPAEVETLISHLVPARDGYLVALWRTADDRVVVVRCGQDRSSWVDESTALRLSEVAPAVVVEDGGPLVIAVRLWRQDLIARLHTAPGLGSRRPTSLEEACSALEAHASQTAAAADRLIGAVAPSGHASVLRARVGPLGLTAAVYPAAEGYRGVDWPVSYFHTEDVSVVAAPAEDENSADRYTDLARRRSSVGALTADSPATAAAKRVRDAIDGFTRWDWL
jgi:hypothetical protein